MKIPYFEDCTNDCPREDKDTVKRKNVFAIIKHSEEDKYCLLDWEKFGWKSFIVGGIDDSETPEEAGMRECTEETGYYDFKIVKDLGFEFNSNFFAKHKDINRYSIERFIYIELNSLSQKIIDLEETKNHEFIWVDYSEVGNFLNLDNNLYAWKLFSENKTEDLDYLKTLKNFKELI